MFFKPALMILFTRTLLYCSEYNLPCKVTSLINDRDDVKTVSNSHADGRAFDISVHGWTEQSIHKFVYLLNRDYADIGAISKSDNQVRTAFYHDSGYGSHIHIQVRPNANIRKFIGE